MCLIMGLMELERSQLFALELGKVAELNSPASTNRYQSAQNLVKMYETNLSLMSLILGQI